MKIAETSGSKPRRWHNIEITGVSDNDSIPIDIRSSLVGLVIPSTDISSNEFPSDLRLAVIEDIVYKLRKSQRYSPAEKLKQHSPNPDDMYLIEPGTYRFVR
jgi:hypothetical protein